MEYNYVLTTAYDGEDPSGKMYTKNFYVDGRVSIK